MKNIKSLLLIVALLTGLIAQSQTPSQNKRAMKDYYDKGDYVNSTLKAIDFLRTNGKNKSAQETLSISFNMAIEDLNIEISELKERSRIFTGDQTVIDRKTIITKYQLLRQLDRKGREIIRVIPKKKVSLEFDKINVSSELEAAQKSLDESIGLAAEMHYNRGIELTESTTREGQKAAAKEFKKAAKYISSYKDCSIRYIEAKKKATTRVAIIPFENKSGTFEFGSVGEITSDKLRAAILNNSEASEFIEIYTRDQLNLVFQEHNLNMDEIVNQESIAKYGEAMGIHMIITGKVMQISAENRQTIKDAAVITKKSVVVGQENYINSKGKQRTRNRWGDVYARNYYHHKSSVASITGSFEMIDIETARILASSQFRDQYEWTNNWSTYTGDQRAAKKPYGYDNGELSPPSKASLANVVVDRLGIKIANDVIYLIK